MSLTEEMPTLHPQDPYNVLGSMVSNTPTRKSVGNRKAKLAHEIKLLLSAGGSVTMPAGSEVTFYPVPEGHEPTGHSEYTIGKIWCTIFDYVNETLVNVYTNGGVAARVGVLVGRPTFNIQPSQSFTDPGLR